MLKDDEEHPIPEAWRASLRQIANAFVDGDFELRKHPVEGVAPIDPATAKHIAENVAAYGWKVDISPCSIFQPRPILCTSSGRAGGRDDELQTQCPRSALPSG